MCERCMLRCVWMQMFCELNSWKLSQLNDDDDDIVSETQIISVQISSNWNRSESNVTTRKVAIKQKKSPYKTWTSFFFQDLIFIGNSFFLTLSVEKLRRRIKMQWRNWYRWMWFVHTWRVDIHFHIVKQIKRKSPVFMDIKNIKLQWLEPFREGADVETFHFANRRLAAFSSISMNKSNGNYQRRFCPTSV